MGKAARVALSHREYGALVGQGHPMTVANSTRVAVFIYVDPSSRVGQRLTDALVRLRTPDATPRERLAESKVQRKHWSERERITLSDLYDADARAVSPAIAFQASRHPVPHPLSGVAYADGTHTSRLPWAKVPR